MAKQEFLYFLDKSAFAEEKFHIKKMPKCGCRLNTQISMPKNQPEFGNWYNKKKKHRKEEEICTNNIRYTSQENHAVLYVEITLPVRRISTTTH
ncbi:hypothetical protein [Blautia sp.]|jgi:hypothetical protein|uniref:hypothetical protein n=1 Tax=Blautia sp. TaxID=1955243 RepID=UPI002E76D9E7|nr:hypothetical protein [Blautia sp.]MEE0811961.1 hypothetical protein [Blautia sp.]